MQPRYPLSINLNQEEMDLVIQARRTLELQDISLSNKDIFMKGLSTIVIIPVPTGGE